MGKGAHRVSMTTTAAAVFTAQPTSLQETGALHIYRFQLVANEAHFMTNISLLVIQKISK